jgi:hypothetical protein
MCDAIGHPVVRLRRRRIGPITDEHIRPGEFRDLTPREVALLRKTSQPRASAASEPPERSGATGPRERRRKRVPGDEVPRAQSRASAASEPPERSGATGPRERRRKGVPGDEVPRTIKAARPRSEQGARGRGSRGGGRPRRG